jgi:hypothetical protein
MSKAGELGSFFFINSSGVGRNKVIKVTSDPAQKFTTFKTAPSV